jgi:hypothetical protein
MNCLDRHPDVGQDAVQRLWQPPRAPAEQSQRDGDEQEADQGGVEQDGDAEDDAISEYLLI